MSPEREIVPALDLAPKLDGPLRLSNPRDFFMPLYWAFFFPQAFPWYVEQFGDPALRNVREARSTFQILRADPNLRRLVIHSGLLIALMNLLTAAVALGWASSGDAGLKNGFEIFVVAFGISFGIAFGIAFGMPWGPLLGGACLIVAAVLDVIFEDTHALVWFSLSFLFFSSRLLDWFLALFSRKGFHYWNRVVWLELPGRRRELEGWLERDWQAGLRNASQVLEYTFQAVPVRKALDAALCGSSREKVLPRVISLLELPVQWQLLGFCSTGTSFQLPHPARSGLIRIPPVRWLFGLSGSRQFPFDSHSRCACAGFWLWHWKETDRALDAFEKVQDIPQGRELYEIARAITEAKAAQDLSAIADWKERTRELEACDLPFLRPRTMTALEILRNVSFEVAAAKRSVAALSRTASLGRAAGQLQNFLDHRGGACPDPERRLLLKIAKDWLDIVVRSAGTAGEEVLRQPSPNPYQGSSGLPVTGPGFVGRRDVMREIEARWSSETLLPSLILYGHRRMGKTSILRNLEGIGFPGSFLVYLNMQDAGWVDHTGQLLLDFTEAIHRRAAAIGLDSGPLPSEARFGSLGEARRELNQLCRRLAPQMAGRRLILAIDEFEVIDKGIQEGRIDAGLLGYLRALGQRHSWLALIFGGLHRLEEMGHDYRSAFYGQAEHIRVSYLAREDAFRLITRPDPNFTLEYAPELCEELYRLTNGQPYLLQRLCWELVNRWNERFLEVGESMLRTLELEDLEPVLDRDLYAGSSYYFDGVWSNVGEGERRAMEAMAAREGSWTADELARALEEKLEKPEEVSEILDALRHHDVILAEGTGFRFASDLMRRWVLHWSREDAAAPPAAAAAG